MLSVTNGGHSAPNGGLDLREGPDGSMVIANLSMHKPTTAEEVFELVAAGNRNRSQAPTDANSESSRSHGSIDIDFIYLLL